MDGELFFQALKDVDDGVLLKQLDGKLCELVSACNETGGSGKVSLVLEVKKCPKERMVKVKPKVAASVPCDAPGEMVLYADKEGRLCTDDPAQGRLDLDFPRRVGSITPEPEAAEYAASAKIS